MLLRSLLYLVVSMLMSREGDEDAARAERSATEAHRRDAIVKTGRAIIFGQSRLTTCLLAVYRHALPGTR